MPTILKTKNSVTTTVVPTTLQQGELAVNITDKKMWVGNAATTPVQLFGAGADGSFVNLAYTGTLTGGTGIVNLGSGQFYKDASGNIGVGTASPSFPLDVAGAIRGNSWIGRTNTSAPSTDAFIYRPADNTLGLGTASTERMRITSSGVLLVGATSPLGVSGELVTLSNSVNTVLSIVATNDTTPSVQFRSNSVDRLTIDSSSNFGAYFNVRNNQDMRFGTNNTERMRIDSSGNVMIGSTTSSGTFYVNKATNDTAARFDTTFNNFSNVNVFSVLFGTNTNTTSCNHFNGYADGANRILIYGNGNIQNQNNSYAGISDIKLKENITDTAPKLDKLKQVRVVNYNLKDSPDQKLLGVVAQELEQIFPNMVEETVDRDIDGNLLETTTKSVKYSVFVPMLIKAMQEQQALIENLTTRLNALEGK